VKSHFPFRRPSPAVIIASLALFVSLGGVGYAAIALPPGSVGSAQLKTHAVTGNKIDFESVGFRKIQLGAVGTRRVNSNQVQLRVNGTCAAGSAIGAIDKGGNATCNATPPKEFGAFAASTAVTGSATTITTKALPGNSTYMVFANPTIDIAGTTGTAPVEIQCTLSVQPGDASTSITRGVTFQPGVTGHQIGSIPLMIPAPSVANGSTAVVTCSKTAAAGGAAVTAASAVNALQTSSNS
jgi:hypothetical protein